MKFDHVICNYFEHLAMITPRWDMLLQRIPNQTGYILTQEFGGMLVAIKRLGDRSYGIRGVSPARSEQILEQFRAAERDPDSNVCPGSLAQIKEPHTIIGFSTCTGMWGLLIKSPNMPTESCMVVFDEQDETDPTQDLPFNISNF